MKRYDAINTYGDAMYAPSPDGEMVFYSDVEAIVTMNAELVEALESMQNLNIKMVRDFNGRTEPWNQIDEEHLHDASVLLAKAKG